MKNNQFRIIADEKHVDKINEALRNIQGRSTARILSAEKILDILKRVESRLDIPKKDLDGVQVVFTFAETFPNAYRYTPESTHFNAVYGNRHWIITNICRSVCPDRNNNIGVILTENAERALLANMRSFRV